jgi:glycosyltransferase involved in cell wall biosynthesis
MMLAREAGSPYVYVFTVFTPTQNRARTLPRVYESLSAQTFRDFEWLVVDDGSTDETQSLVEQWREEAALSIRYVYQEHQGKHVAFNRAARESRGELFLNLDSDDRCVPHALERLKHHWDSIPDDRRAAFSSVTVHCMDPQGKLIGDMFPRDVTDSDPLEIRYRFHVRGEKWGFQRTDVMRQYPFPEMPAGSYVAEDIVWSRIGCTARISHPSCAGRWPRRPLAGGFNTGPCLRSRSTISGTLRWSSAAPRSITPVSRFMPKAAFASSSRG